MLASPSHPVWMFCPGDRPDRFQKALGVADFLIIDLEDAVAFENKEQARSNIREGSLPPARVAVRINGADPVQAALDARAIAQSPYHHVMIAKCERVSLIAALLPGRKLIPQIESPTALRDIDNIAAHRSVAMLTWGPEDLAARLGATSRDGQTWRAPLQFARTRVLFAAAAAGKPALDAPILDIDDDVAIHRAAADAFADGFAGVSCIHPRQTGMVRRGFTPDARQQESAERTIALGSVAAVTKVDGRMVDAPVVAQARRTIAQVSHDG